MVRLNFPAEVAARSGFSLRVVLNPGLPRRGCRRVRRRNALGCLVPVTIVGRHGGMCHRSHRLRLLLNAYRHLQRARVETLAGGRDSPVGINGTLPIGTEIRLYCMQQIILWEVDFVIVCMLAI